MRRTMYYIVAVVAIAIVCNGMPSHSDSTIWGPLATESSPRLHMEELEIKAPSPLAIASGLPFAGVDAEAEADRIVAAMPPLNLNQDADKIVPEDIMPPVRHTAADLVEVQKAAWQPSRPIAQGISYEGVPLGSAKANVHDSTEKVIQKEIDMSKKTHNEVQTNVEKKAAEAASGEVAKVARVQKQIEDAGKKEVEALESKISQKKAQEPLVGKQSASTAHEDKTTTKPAKVDCHSEVAHSCEQKCALCAGPCAEAIKPASSKCDICKKNQCKQCIPFMKCKHGKDGKAQAEASAAATVSTKGRGPLLSNKARAAAGPPVNNVKASQQPKAQQQLKSSKSAASSTYGLTFLTLGVTALVALMQ